mgnify:CR=1 FL=1|jgi:hypothetical protein
MVSFLGLRLSDALNLAEENGLKPSLVFYNSQRGVKDSDSKIVIRQRIKENHEIELIVSEFKTVV